MKIGLSGKASFIVHRLDRSGQITCLANETGSTFLGCVDVSGVA
ncbi:MAG: hypothetical protein M5U24_06730 [Candidatus Kuenenia sp.]|nr:MULTISPECIES: hypothetical protein [Kuenenia]MCZ7622166.1 hypothetical protein [Candidatus Kuenenia sp.]